MHPPLPDFNATIRGDKLRRRHRRMAIRRMDFRDKTADPR
jgi:hypothetical protein